jgi:hypothetical protein
LFEWPTLFPRANTPAWLAVILLAADAFVELLRTPRRSSRGGASPPV